MRRRVATAVSCAASAALALCMLPAAAFASGNATLAEQEANNASIQEALDGLDSLEAGEDYVADEVLVTYSGQDEPQQVTLDSETSVADALEDAICDDMVTSAQPNYIYRLTDAATSSSDQDAAGQDVSDEGDADISSTAASAKTAQGTQTASVDDRFAAAQYYLDGDNSDTKLKGANVRAAWDLVKTNQSVTVAVLDTGLQLTHEDLSDNVDTVHMATVDSSGKVVVGSIDDDQGHGTHVAGILAASANNGVGVAGSSYNATVLPICVFEDGNTTTLQCINALEYLDGLVESGQLANLHVLNMSLGGYAEENEDTMFYDAIAHLRNEHDVVAVCAGGNGDKRGNPITDPCWPSDWDVCVSVTSLDAYGRDSSWSDYNENKDISAPGEKILSAITDDYAQELVREHSKSLCVKDKNASYGYMEGTSMAAPLVSGIFALMWATYPSLSADAAVAIVKSTAADVIPSKSSVIWFPIGDRVVNGSAGRIDAAAAVAAVQELAAANGDTAISDPQPVQVTSTTPDAVSNLKVKARAKRRLAISWTTALGVAGYQVRYKVKGTSSWKSKSIASALAGSATLSSLKSGKSYKVKIRSWRVGTSGQKLYGAWGAAVTKKAK